MCRLEVCGYTRTREYGSGRVDALRVHHTITNIACWNLRSKIKKLFIWWYRCYMSWKPRCWNRKYNTNKTPQRYCSFVEILHSLWTKVLGQTDMVPLRCSIFTPGVQRTRQFEIEQHGKHNYIEYDLTWKEWWHHWRTKHSALRQKKQKRRAVLLPSSVCLWHLRQWEPTRLRHGWVHIVYHACD